MRPTVWAVLGIAAMVMVACEPHVEPAVRYRDAADRPREAADSLIAAAPPPFSDGIFPCSNCHLPEDEVDRTTRELFFHTDIELHHDEENRWCLDCHDANNRDQLHLADGQPVAFTESYRLCGQCHGTQARDWKAGEHGKRTGSWSGEKQYLLCVSCHNPHSPSFKPIEPEDPPLRQEDIK